MIFRARRYDFLPIYLRFFQIFFGRPEKTGKQPENSYLCTDGNTVRQYPHPPSDRTRHRARERRDTSVGGCRRRSCDRAGACRPGTDRRRDRSRLPASRPRGATADFRRAAATGRGGRKTRRTALREGIRGDDAAAQTVPPAGRHLPRVHRFARTGRTRRRRRLRSPRTVRALGSIPTQRLFLETDDAPATIESVYATAARLLGMPLDRLKETIYNNYLHIFS